MELKIELTFEFNMDEICQRVAMKINERDISPALVLYSKETDMVISQLLFIELQHTFLLESKIKLDEFALLNVKNMGVGSPMEMSPKKEFIQKIKQILLIEDESLNLINEL